MRPKLFFLYFSYNFTTFLFFCFKISRIFAVKEDDLNTTGTYKQTGKLNTDVHHKNEALGATHTQKRSGQKLYPSV